MTAAHVVCVNIAGLHIVSEANTREHWRTKAKRAKEHRRKAYEWMHYRKTPVLETATITLTRIAPRSLDGDNLQSGFKAVRDGVADWLGIDDGDKRLTWRYEQRKGEPWTYSAEIRVEWEA